MEVCYSHYKCEFRRNGLQIRSSEGDQAKQWNANSYFRSTFKDNFSGVQDNYRWIYRYNKTQIHVKQNMPVW